VRTCDPHRRDDVIRRSGPTHCERATLGHTGVARVQREFERLGTDAVGSERGAQIVEQGVQVRDIAEPTD
jgi:hypothetical protein